MSDRGGQHAAGDGSFPRSAGGAMARGIGLIIVAIVLGVVLLNATDSPEPFRAESTAADDDGGTTGTDDGGEAAEGEGETTTTTAQPPRNPAEVAVLVANGSGVSGAAGRIAELLKGSNYVLKDSTNSLNPAESSVVYFTEGYEADARAVAALLTPAPGVSAMPDPIPVRDLAGANVLVVVAADLAAG